MDQGLSSISNLLATIAIARVAQPDEFGAFGVVMSVYLLSVTVGKGAVGGVVGLRLSHLDPPSLAVEARKALTAALAVSLGVAALIVVAAVATPNPVRPMLFLLAITAPALILQDVLRQVAYSLRRPWIAATNSAAWLLIQSVAFLVLAVAGFASPFALATAWAASSLAGLVLAVFLLDLPVSLRRASSWFVDHGSMIKSLLVEYALVAGVAQGAPLLVGLISGLAEIGALRGSISMFGPLTMAAHGLALALVPSAARKWASGSTQYLTQLRLVGFGLGLGCVLWGVVLTVIPLDLGEKILGENWRPASHLFLLVSLWLGLGYATEPAVTALRIAGRNWAAALVRSWLAPVTLLATAVGCLVDDAAGATLGLAVTALVGAITFWYLVRSSPPTSSGDAGGAGTPPPAI